MVGFVGRAPGPWALLLASAPLCYCPRALLAGPSWLLDGLKPYSTALGYRPKDRAPRPVAPLLKGRETRLTDRSPVSYLVLFQ